MNGPTEANPERARTDLARLESEGALDLRFVAEEAGDHPMTAEARELHAAERQRRGAAFHGDLLFVLTHRRYPQGAAETLWDQILAHKEGLNERLGRNVGVAVAALDYLGNVRREEIDLGLISATRLSAVAELALKDALTGLYDRAAFRSRLDQELQRFSRFGDEFSLVMIDVDRFKRFNDTFGHPDGDEALRRVSRAIAEESRKVDLAARYGGEEFIVVLPSTGGEEAFTQAERIRGRVERSFRERGGLTLSLGIATCPRDGTTPAELVQAADRALYASKRQGRNRTSRV